MVLKKLRSFNQIFKKISKIKNIIDNARLAQANLVSKNEIANFVKKTNFNDKLKHLNKTVTSNKIKQVPVENELNELSEKVKAISAKGLTKDLINKYSILNGAKCFYSGILQKYFEFLPAKKTH